MQILHSEVNLLIYIILNGNTTKLLFSLKELEILHQERRGQVKTIAMEHFNVILFHKSRSANKQYTKQSINIIAQDQDGYDIYRTENNLSILSLSCIAFYLL